MKDLIHQFILFIKFNLIFINNYWLIPSRLNIIFNKFILILFKEFSISINRKLISNLLIFLSIIFFIIFINFFRLFPYIFSWTRHLLFNLSISLSLWLRFFIFQLFNYPINFSSHLVPLNSPKFLIHFIVIIELIRLIIRPWTLSIRLSSNWKVVNELVPAPMNFDTRVSSIFFCLFPLILSSVQTNKKILSLTFHLDLTFRYIEWNCSRSDRGNWETRRFKRRVRWNILT